MKAKNISLSALLIALALALSYTERLIPLNLLVPLPGVKLGLANIVTMFALYTMATRKVAVILILRCIMGSIFGGGITALAFSLTGGILVLLGATYFLRPAAEKNADTALQGIMTQLLPGENTFTPEEYSGEDEAIRTLYKANSGYVIEVSAQGYVDEILLLVGVRNGGTVAGLTVKDSGETAGLGQTILHGREFLSQYLGTTGDAAVGETIDALTGATATTKAVTRAVNSAVAAPAFRAMCRRLKTEKAGLLAGDVFESYSAGTETKPRINPDAVRLMKQIHGIDTEATQYSKLLSELPPMDVVITWAATSTALTSPAPTRRTGGWKIPQGETMMLFWKRSVGSRKRYFSSRRGYGEM